MHCLYGALLLVLTICSAAHAEFSYPLSPGTYRLYYADDVRDQIRTCTLSFSPVDDAPSLTGDEALYAASNPSGLAACGEYLYWIEGGATVYRGEKDASVPKVSIISGLGGFADDLIVRGGSLYITDTVNPDTFGLLQADLLGNRVRTEFLPGQTPNGIEKVAMNFLVRGQNNDIYSFPFNGGPRQLLTTVEPGGFDITVADTSLVWGVAEDNIVSIYKKSLGGGGESTPLYVGVGDGVRYMDALDNRIFFGFINGGQSQLGLVGVRGTAAGSRGLSRNINLTPNTGLRGFVVEKLNLVKNDFDGDGLADRSVYYPATGQWYIFGTATGFYTDQFGYPGTIPVPGDYDGDGTTDYGIFDPPAGRWQIFRSSLGYFNQSSFGNADMIPCVSDYDADGKSDLCLYYPAEGRWHVVRSQSGYLSDQFGNAFMIPVDTQTRAQ